MTTDLRLRLRRIDPAPVDAEPPSGAMDAAAVLHEIERRMGMDTRDTTDRKATPPGVTQEIKPKSSPEASERRNDTGKRRWSGALVGAAAFAVVVIVVGAVILLASLGSDEVDPAAPVTTQAPPTTQAQPQITVDEALETATSFMEAQDAFDAEAVVALVAPEGVVDDGFGLVNQVEEYPSHLAWKEAMGWRLTVEECTETASGPPAQVTCTYVYENAWIQALGRPLSRDIYQFVIANGQIQELSAVFGPSGFLIEAWMVFRDWVRDNHPEDVAVMYDFSDPADEVPIVTPEALVLWEQHTNEFVASVTEPGTP